MSPALRECVRALVTGQKPWPLYLFGPAGSGKTFAALCVLDHFGPVTPSGKVAAEARDVLAGFWHARKSVALKLAADAGRLEWSREGNGGSYSWPRLMSLVAGAPVYVFDELGVGGTSDFAAETLLEAIDQRDGHPVRPFVGTSNLSPEELARAVDGRTCSRVLCGTVFHLAGPDRRRERAAGAGKGADS